MTQGRNVPVVKILIHYFHLLLGSRGAIDDISILFLSTLSIYKEKTATFNKVAVN